MAKLADLGFQAAQALGDGALRDGKPLGRALEAALVSQGGQAVESGGVQVFHKSS